MIYNCRYKEIKRKNGDFESDPVGEVPIVFNYFCHEEIVRR